MYAFWTSGSKSTDACEACDQGWLLVTRNRGSLRGRGRLVEFDVFPTSGSNSADACEMVNYCLN